MTFAFGNKSLGKLSTCHPDLIKVAAAAIAVTPIDFTIVHGWRGEDIQNALFESGASKKPWPESKHNRIEVGENIPNNTNIPNSFAIDFAPWINGAIPWKDTHAFAIIAGVFFAVSGDIQLRFGGDWDMDGLTIDQTFMDWGHIELV